MNLDENFMLRAFDLAKLGFGQVSPNPMVGCLVVNNGVIIGEGWHKKFGGPHAEVNAIESVQDKDLLSTSTIYVNLEPCSHHGKTPPCTDLLINSGVKKVVLSTNDPNSKVSGGGINILRGNGIEVIENVLYDEGRELNARFFTNQEKLRPYIILKWAQTRDGFIARADNTSKWISSEESRKLVHKWRSEEDAILIGRVTAKLDNPRLDVRDWTGRNPIRVVLDTNLKLTGNLNILDQSTMTIIYNFLEERTSNNLNLVKIDRDEDLLQAIMSDLVHQNIGSIIVEGGSRTLQSFIDKELWDEARVFTSEKTFREGINAPILGSKVFSSTVIGNDLLEIYKNI